MGNDHIKRSLPPLLRRQRQLRIRVSDLDRQQQCEYRNQVWRTGRHEFTVDIFGIEESLESVQFDIVRIAGNDAGGTSNLLDHGPQCRPFTVGGALEPQRAW